MAATTKLVKTETGYATPDGRWTITRNEASGGVNMIGGYSANSIYWTLEDTTGKTKLTHSQKNADRLWQLRDFIAALLRMEASS